MGNIVTDAGKTLPKVAPNVIASAVAVIAGSIVLAIGLARCGWIVDLISLTAISAFMTGSALNIAVGQVPGLMGLSGFSSRDATYLVVINSLKSLNTTTLDAAFGFTSLAMLYIIRSACKFSAKSFPSQQKLFFFISTLRTVFVILLYTLISWLVVRKNTANPRIKILGTVPRGELFIALFSFLLHTNHKQGFQNAAVPTINIPIIQSFLTDLPATVIVMLIEHIAISKSFGRVNNYIINPSQELVGIGVTNVLGPFLGAYPATGSFSRTAIKSKAGVRTPLAGVITAIVVLLAIYALTGLFYWIPNAALSAVIIHAVGDLITSPNTLYKFWRVSPFEVIIFFIGVIVTVFSSIEDGIYCTISISFAILIFRFIKAQGRFLGRVKVHSVIGDDIVGDKTKAGHSIENVVTVSNLSTAGARNIFIPVDHGDGSNPEIEVTSPYDGIFIYRFSEGFNYPNANHYLDYLTNYIFAHTRRTNPDLYAKPGDRPWNDPGPRHGRKSNVNNNLPTLKAIILDFSSVNNVDITSVQQLIDVRNQLDRYASPDTVDWHLACINNRWTKRALASAGFGFSPVESGHASRWKPIFSVAEIGGSDSAARVGDVSRRQSKEDQAEIGADKISKLHEVIHGGSGSETYYDVSKVPKAVASHARVAVVHSLGRPLFHIDLTSALQSAIANVEEREKINAKGGQDIEQTPAPWA